MNRHHEEDGWEKANQVEDTVPSKPGDSPSLPDTRTTHYSYPGTLHIPSSFIHQILIEQPLGTKHFILGTFTWLITGHLKHNWPQTPATSMSQVMATLLPDAQAKTLESSLPPLSLTPYIQPLCKPCTLYLQNPS